MEHDMMATQKPAPDTEKPATPQDPDEQPDIFPEAEPGRTEQGEAEPGSEEAGRD
jgi:hypothetical protein